MVQRGLMRLMGAGAEMHDTPFEVVRAIDSGCAVALTESAGGTACVRAVRLADMKEVNNQK